MTDLQDFLHAAAFAARKHRLQKRKDAEASPYINNPLEVAASLAEEGGVTDVLTLVAAVLHDTLGDTETTQEELATTFGANIRVLRVRAPDAQRPGGDVQASGIVTGGCGRVSTVMGPLMWGRSMTDDWRVQ
jgi:GTP diphosphokinase / guanosine-3',5'-bis(diphosphate) 3'-diphosphatase